MVFAKASNSAIFLRFNSIFSSILPRTPAMGRFRVQDGGASTGESSDKVEVCYEDENIWMSQKMLA